MYFELMLFAFKKMEYFTGFYRKKKNEIYVFSIILITLQRMNIPSRNFFLLNGLDLGYNFDSLKNVLAVLEAEEQSFETRRIFANFDR